MAAWNLLTHRIMPIEPSRRIDRARALATLLDWAFRVPGTGFRFGADAILGLVPRLGDAIGAGFGCYLLALAYRADAEGSVLLRMLANGMMVATRAPKERAPLAAMPGLTSR